MKTPKFEIGDLVHFSFNGKQHGGKIKSITGNLFSKTMYQVSDYPRLLPEYALKSGVPTLAYKEDPPELKQLTADEAEAVRLLKAFIKLVQAAQTNDDSSLTDEARVKKVAAIIAALDKTILKQP